MAPRGRPRKRVGQTRMDAAVDALSPMGFPKGVIRSKVNALLKVYEGEWQFIEESAYRILIDSILEGKDEKQNDEAIEDGDSDSDGAEPSNAHAAANVCDGAEISTPRDAEPSNAHGDAEPSNAHGGADVCDGAEISTPCDAEPSSSGATMRVPTSTQTEHKAAKHDEIGTSCIPQAVAGQEWKDISCMDHDRSQDMAIETATNKNGSGNGTSGVGQNGMEGAVGLLLPGERKPCYGWIGSDDEEDCVFSLTELSQRKEMNRHGGSQKDRKYRWDVKQEA